MELEGRVSRLERENRIWRTIAAVGLAIFACKSGGDPHAAPGPARFSEVVIGDGDDAITLRDGDVQIGAGDETAQLSKRGLEIEGKDATSLHASAAQLAVQRRNTSTNVSSSGLSITGEGGNTGDLLADASGASLDLRAATGSNVTLLASETALLALGKLDPNDENAPTPNFGVTLWPEPVMDLKDDQGRAFQLDTTRGLVRCSGKSNCK